MKRADSTQAPSESGARRATRIALLARQCFHHILGLSQCVNALLEALAPFAFLPLFSAVAEVVPHFSFYHLKQAVGLCYCLTPANCSRHVCWPGEGYKRRCIRLWVQGHRALTPAVCNLSLGA